MWVACPGHCTDHSHRHPSDAIPATTAAAGASSASRLPLSLLTYFYLSTSSSAHGVATDFPPPHQAHLQGKRYAALKRTLSSPDLPLHVLVFALFSLFSNFYYLHLGLVYTTVDKSTDHEKKRAFLNCDWSKMQLLSGGCLH